MERGSVVSKLDDPPFLGVTGEIGAGAVEVLLIKGSEAIFASKRPISFACKNGAKLAIRAASFGLVPR